MGDNCWREYAGLQTVQICLFCRLVLIALLEAMVMHGNLLLTMTMFIILGELDDFLLIGATLFAMLFSL